MNKKEREEYKRDKIRNLWVYMGLSIRSIADLLNKDPEFIRKCGSISVPTVQYWIKKIKGELENAIDIDGMERFTAEFVRTSEFMDSEVDDLTNMINSPNIKMDDKIKLINLRHRVKVDQMTLLADRELPLTVKKYKKDRQKNLSLLPKEEPQMLDVKWQEDSQV